MLSFYSLSFQICRKERELLNNHTHKAVMTQFKGLEGKEKQVSRIIPFWVYPSLPPPLS